MFNLDKFQEFCNLVSSSKYMESESIRNETASGIDIKRRIIYSICHLDTVLWNIKSNGDFADKVKRFIFYADDKQKKYIQDDTEYSDIKKVERLAEIPRLLHSLLGLITEAGEFAECLIKFIDTGKLDKVNTGEELADSGWYLCEGASGLQCKLSDLLNKVQDKLEVRYNETLKSGKFKSKDAIERDLQSERKALEGQQTIEQKVVDSVNDLVKKGEL